MNFEKCVGAETIDLKEIGWSASRDDEQIKKYVKSWFKKNYDREIDDELVFIIVFMIDDVLTEYRKPYIPIGATSDNNDFKTALPKLKHS